MDTVTRSTLVEKIHAHVGLSRHDSSCVLETMLEQVSEQLSQGETVKLSGFGTFSVRRKSERIGRNPKTGVEVPILPRAVLVFRPSQLLRNRLNNDKVTSTEHDQQGND